MFLAKSLIRNTPRFAVNPLMVRAFSAETDVVAT
jgi:hypothetical protein